MKSADQQKIPLIRLIFRSHSFDSLITLCAYSLGYTMNVWIVIDIVADTRSLVKQYPRIVLEAKHLLTPPLFEPRVFIVVSAWLNI